MEQGPNPLYEYQRNTPETGPGRQSPEQLLPRAPESRPSAEQGKQSKSFEELVHEALEEELKFERDPQLRQNASQRADEILAEFQNARTQPQDGTLPDPSSDQTNEDRPPQERSTQTNPIRHPQPPKYPAVSGNFGTLDLVLAVIIAVLVLIIILILIF